jgi:hypothetical protein
MSLAAVPIAEDGLPGGRRPGRHQSRREVRGRDARPRLRDADDTGRLSVGLAYKLHYGTTQPNPPDTLDDGTIRRYDNSHEDTKGHELHVAPDPEPETIEFPGMVELWERFWSEIPKAEFELD